MLTDNLKAVLGTSFVLYAKASSFHWNIEGPDFTQLHELFGDVYDEAYGNIDRTAEFIRILDQYAPGSLARFIELSSIKEQEKVPRAELMITELRDDCQTMITVLRKGFDVATSDDSQGIANFLAERIDAFGKLHWKLRSHLKKNRG